MENKIVIIHGQNHKGSTYHIAHDLAEKIGGDIQEFFLPTALDKFCVGCMQCISVSEDKCPHHEMRDVVTRAMDEADVIILASPVYVYHATGAMKNFLDHYAYRWMVHRPEEKMFRKIGVCISTAAGAGMKSTNKDMKDSLFFWGVPKVYTYGKAVAAGKWEEVGSGKREDIEDDLKKLSKSIRKKIGKAKPGFKTKGFFAIMRMMQKSGWCEPDVAYWKEKGWNGKIRPWK